MQEKTTGNVFEHISKIYYELTTTEKKIADYIMSNPEFVEEAGISDLADACATAVASVSRFSRRLGFSGFNAMKIAVAQAISSKTDSPNLLSGKIQMDDSFGDLCKKIQTADMSVISQTYELIQQEDYL